MHAALIPGGPRPIRRLGPHGARCALVPGYLSLHDPWPPLSPPRAWSSSRPGAEVVPSQNRATQFAFRVAMSRRRGRGGVPRYLDVEIACESGERGTNPPRSARSIGPKAP